MICGPTSSGKSALALKLARRFNGEIVSADSRQVYRGLDIGTSKPTAAEQKAVPHHLIDIFSPQHEFSVGEYKKLASQAIARIHQKKHLPFLVGGAGLYIDAVASGWSIPEVPPEPQLRAALEAKSFAQLFSQLRELDPETARTIDRHNKRRLIRALEVCLRTGDRFSRLRKKDPVPFAPLFLALAWPRAELYRRIDQTIDQMISRGLKTEVAHLLQKGLSPARLFDLGLEYRFIGEVFSGRLSERAAIQKLKTASHQYAKRQLTWFKRNKDIHWLPPDKAESEARQLIEKWLSS